MKNEKTPFGLALSEFGKCIIKAFIQTTTNIEIERPKLIDRFKKWIWRTK